VICVLFGVFIPSFCLLTLQVTRIDGTVDSPPCLKVTHKTFGTQNSNNDMVYCRLSMPVEFYSADRLLDESLKLRSDTRLCHCLNLCFISRSDLSCRMIHVVFTILKSALIFVVAANLQKKMEVLTMAASQL